MCRFGCDRMPPSKLDAFARRLAVDVAPICKLRNLLDACRCDIAGRPPRPPISASLDALMSAAERTGVLDTPPSPFINGRDLMAFGVRPGKAMGLILGKLFDMQISGQISSRESSIEYFQTHRLKLLESVKPQS